MTDPETLLISTDAARAAARPHAAEYRARKPYPYGSFDDFLPPEVLDRVREELSQLPEAERSFDRPQEKLKASYIPERLPTYTRNFSTPSIHAPSSCSSRSLPASTG